MILFKPAVLQMSFKFSVSLMLLCLFLIFYLTTWVFLNVPCSSNNNQGIMVSSNHIQGIKELSSSKHRLCVLVPFRDRFEELQTFAPHLKSFLDNQGIDYQLLIINQVDRYRFNRASLINVGYFESKMLNCDYMAMHDVDLLPNNQQLSYRFPKEGPFHVASPDYHPKYHYRKFVGGILLITLEHFEKINGLSNRYWGWGLEDDEFYKRLKEANLTIYRPVNLRTTINDTFIHIHDVRMRRRDKTMVGDQEKASFKRDRVSGVDTVKYRVLSRVPMRIKGADITIINVQLYCNIKLTQWCKDSKRYFDGQFPNTTPTIEAPEIED